MDQVATGGETLHDSTRSNEILTLLCSFINQSGTDYRTSAATQAVLPAPATVSGPSASIVVAAAAGIADPTRRPPPEDQQLETFHRQQASSSSDATADGDCSCSGIDDCLESTNDEVTEEEIARLGDIAPEIIESVTAASSHSFAGGEELIRPNNICKTISEIASSQQIAKDISSMPQNNSLFEATLISNLTSAAAAAQSGGNGFLVQPALGMEQGQGAFHVQNWNVDAMNPASVACDNPAYANRQTFPVAGVNQAALPGAFPNAALEAGGSGGGYLPYASQAQFGMARHDQLGSQLHGGVPFGVTDYQGNVLRADAINASAPRSQDMTQTAHSKIGNAYPAMNFNPTSVAMSPNTDISGIPYSGSYNGGSAKGPNGHRHGQGHADGRVDSGSEESVSEDRTGEKKLTTTPIPSDAEKMSSSNSVSSGSHDESPSPGEPEDARSGNPALSQSAAAAAVTSAASDYHLNSSGAGGEDFRAIVDAGMGDMLLNEEGMINAIPVPDSVVEIGDVGLEYGQHHNPHHADPVPAAGNSNVSVPTKSPAASGQSKAESVDASSAAAWPTDQKAASGKKRLEEMQAADTWSVRKEKRKRRLHKKHKKSKHQEELSSQEEGFGGDGDPSSSGISRDQNVEYRQRHHSKHHSSSADAQSSSSSSSSSSSKSPNSDSKTFVSYSSMIPKTTADPIGMANPASSSSSSSKKAKSAEAKHWDASKHKEKSSEKKLKKRPQNPTGAVPHDHKIIAPASLQMPSAGAANTNNSNNPSFAAKAPVVGTSATSCSSQSAGVRRWQTVTAIQGPKLPPMLSESDRIPKRGRPSKKMKELNLKYKPAETAAVDPAPQTKVKPSESASKMVSMYTINDKGFIEVLTQKPKENRRSKERAEAFRNLLTEISKRSSIQKKTAGAKDVVGAFKQIGVRTRNQASTTTGSSSSAGDEKKRQKSKSKVFGGDTGSGGGSSTANAPPESSKTEDGMYTFSELANKYKISDSILYRAMEQSQRSTSARSKSAKTAQKSKPAAEVMPKTEFKREKDKAYRAGDMKMEKKRPPVAAAPIKVPPSRPVMKDAMLVGDMAAVSAFDSAPREKLAETRVMPAAVADVSLASEPGSPEKAKKKKKKKKHKREKHEDGKRKKNRDKKKKKKKDRRSSERSLQLEEKRSIQLQSDVNNNNQDLILGYSGAGEAAKKKKPKMSGSSSSSLGSSAIGNRPESTSSLSGAEEDNAYDGGDSSSDAETPLPAGTSIQPVASAGSTPMSSTLAAGAAQSVFGSGIASSQMPSFQGIKEHGGLVQFSEHTRKIEELHEARVSKKHKHKKKKLVRRSKNAADPAFLYSMDELSQKLARTRISAFLSGGATKQDNVFGRDFQPRGRASSLGGRSVDDSLSYRDPARQRFKSKRQPFAAPGFGVFSAKAGGKAPFTQEQFRHVSTFCRLGFFAEHGLVKPYSGGSPLAVLKSISAQAAAKPTVPFESSARQEATKAPSSKANPVAQPSRRTECAESNSKNGAAPQSDSDVETTGAATKKGKRKRGWPLGKPRGPRAKKPSFDEDASTDAELAEKRRRSVDGEPKPSGARTQSEQPQDDASKRGAKKGKQGETSGLEASQPGQEKSQISHDLVNHIKAAIAASLTSTVPPDVVTKTVDSAVADYLSRVSDDTAPKRAPSATPGSEAAPIRPEKKPRGRPPKQPKAVSEPAGKADADKGSEKPKKLWASKHQVAPLRTSRDSLAAERGVVGRPKKRGPGRPRKFPLAVANKKKPAVVRTSSKKTDGAFPLHGARRANASFAPSARPAVLEAQRKKAAKAKRPPLVIQKRPARPKIPTDTVISSQHARLALGSLLSNKAFREQSSSSTWLSSVNAPAPGLYHGQAAEGHMDDAINAAVRNAGAHSSGASGSSSTSTAGQRTGPKKSLESVVARLKSRQSVTGEETDFLDDGSDSFAANNHHGAEKRPRVRSCLDDSDDDSSPFKKLKPSDDVNLDYRSDRPNNPTSHYSRASKTPEERKVFQTVGLFSPAFKMGSEDDLGAEEEGEDAGPLMPPPMHAGKFLRKTRKDFQLPYGVWWMYNRRLISARQDPATQFVKIDSNVYVDTQPVAEQEEHICVCKTLSAIRSERSSDPGKEQEAGELGGCGKECLNRLMYIECSPETCPCGEKCGNRAIQNKQWCTGLERFRTQDRGWGVKTNAAIPEGQFILEYVGEVVSDREFRRRTIENYNAHNDHYCIQLEAGKVIDGYRMANEGRFVNHSCSPNCEMQKWVVNGEYRIGLFAKRKIDADEELTYDYNFHAYNLDRQQVCRCGAKECRGVIGGKTQRVYPESILNRMNKVVGKSQQESQPKPEKKQKEQGSAEQHYTTIVVNNVQLGIREIDSQQTAMLTKQERVFVRSRCLFLLRNLHQNKQQKMKIRQYRQKDPPRNYSNEGSTDSTGENGTEDKATLLERAISDVYTAVMTCKDENGICVAIPFINLPSKLQNPDYYQHVTDPLDLTCVEQKLVTKQYKTFDSFCSDILRVFRNAEKYHGRKSTLGRDVARLRKAFTAARNAAAVALGECRDKSKKKDEEAERAEMVERRKNSDFIRCICGIYKDEGVMIQCEKCYVWQHCDCMGVLPDDYNDERAYLCEECDERDVPDQVKVVPQPPNAPPGHTYYLTLKKDNMTVKQGDCVRIIHDHCLRQRSSSNPPVRSSYRLQSNSASDRKDFLRIKKLWTDDNGDKFAYGHHFVRPHDVRHGDARRFYSNELIATPFHEIVPLDAVVSVCYVMDVETYRLGKPKGVKEADIYISEHRCTASLRVVDKVATTRYPVYTKPHVFDTYKEKLAPVRDYQVPEQYRKTQARRTQWLKATEHGTKSDSEESSGAEDCGSHLSSGDEEDDGDLPAGVAAQHVAMETGGEDGELEDSGSDRNVKKKRLNGILSKLMKDASSRAPTGSQSSSPTSE